MSKPESIVYIDKAAVFYELPARAAGVIECDVEAMFKNLDIHTGQASRDLLENNPYKLHPITYGTIGKWVDVAGAERVETELAILVYDRPVKGNGEVRLSGMSSIGIGGHYERFDVKHNDDGSIALYKTTVETGLREKNEEVTLDHMVTDATPTAVIYDPSDNVGLYHLGVWGLSMVPSETEIVGSEDQILNPRWELLESINPAKFESWSRLLIAHLQSNYLPKKAGDHDGDMYEDGHDRLRALAEE